MSVAYHSDRVISWHEAHHAASFLMDGWPLTRVTVDGGPPLPDGTVGRVHPEEREFDIKNLRIFLLATLLGPVGAEGSPQADIMCWPIEPDEWQPPCRGDARLIKFAVDCLHLDQIGWGQMVYKARERTRDQRFKKLVVEVSSQLEQKNELFRHELDQIARKVLESE